jgi:3-phosphoshikimate 1-carboxyvinyltransferase
MMSLSIEKGTLNSKVNLPSSKSYANRALILAAIINKPIAIENLSHATDVTNLILCLKKIGLTIKNDNGILRVSNSFPACELQGAELDVGDGGTTARFLAALLLLGKSPYTLKLGKRLKDRPWNEFIDLATSLGAKAELTGDLLKLQGPLILPLELKIDCSKTTQFASAFQLIAFDKSIKVIPVNLKSSISYWQMTEKIMSDMKKEEIYQVPLDWSSASYPLAFGALNQEIIFPGLKPDSFQADGKFLEILKKFHAISFSIDGSIQVVPHRSSEALNYDVSDALDLVPALAFLLCHIPGRHQLTGIGNLIYKESDRLNEVISLLKIFEKHAFTDGASLWIEGNESRINKRIDLKLVDDHRIIMTGALFLLHHAGGTIEPSEAVKKSYPDFFKIIKS